MNLKIICFILLELFSCLAFGCSIPEGGFIDTGIETKVHYATIVAVGTVTEITQDPSYWGSVESVNTYGARVVIWCSYKGGALPRTIQIGEAGYIPGMCFSNDLELNKEYILFLHAFTGEGYYVQAEASLPVSRLNELVNVCDLNLTYPTGPGTSFDMCPAPNLGSDCERYEEPSWETEMEDDEAEGAEEDETKL